MVGLIDIAPASASVSIRGSEVDVFGVSASGLGKLFNRFPELRQLFAGRDLDVETLVGLGGEIVAAIIAAGTGAAGDPAAEKVADSLGLEEQTDLLVAILKATLKSGVGPFVEKLAAVGAEFGVNLQEPAQAEAPDTKSPKPSKP